MYFVDRNKIEQQLQFIEKLLQIYSTFPKVSDAIEKLAFERLAHVLVEAVIDVGNAMIDGFIMRDPGSYEDIIEILLDENVLSKEEAHQLIEMVKLRKTLVQQYTDIDHAQLAEVIEGNKQALEKFPARVRDYLNTQLGPVTAFR